MAGLAALILVENVPIPRKSFAARSFLLPDPLVVTTLTGEAPSGLLHLPSKPGGALFRDSGDLSNGTAN